MRAAGLTLSTLTLACNPAKATLGIVGDSEPATTEYTGSSTTAPGAGTGTGIETGTGTATGTGTTTGPGTDSGSTTSDADADGYTVAQGDCDDGNANVNPGAVETCNGIDDNCSGDESDAPGWQTWYADNDGDGYGDPAAGVDDCSQPVGYVADDADCYDGNADAHPGQAAYFDIDRGDGSFDYDCDGSQEQRWTSQAACSVIWTGCSVGGPPIGNCYLTASGWNGSVPNCGVSGNYVASGLGVCGCVNPSACGLVQAGTSTTQECR